MNVIIPIPSSARSGAGSPRVPTLRELCRPSASYAKVVVYARSGPPPGAGATSAVMSPEAL